MIDPTLEQAIAPSKEDWKEPLWAKFKDFCWGFGKAVVLIALFLVGVALYQGYKEHNATVEAVQNPPSGLPEIGASPSAKIAPKGKNIATDNIATQAINTPATPSFEGRKAPIKKSRFDDGFTAEFDKLVLNFESQL